MNRPLLRTVGASSALGLIVALSGCGQILGLDDFTLAGDAGSGDHGGDQGATSSSGAGEGGGGQGGDGGAEDLPLEVSAAPKMGILRAQVLTANKPVTWSLEGGDESGRIDADGRYLSPATPGDYKVTATEKGGEGQSVTKTIRAVPLGIEIVAGKPAGRGTLGGTPARARFEYIRGIGAASEPLVADDRRLRRVLSNDVKTIAGGLYAADASLPPPAADEIQDPTVIASDYNGDNFWIASSDGTCIRKLAISTNEVTAVAGKCRDDTTREDAATGDAVRFSRISAIASNSTYNSLFVCDSGALRQLNQLTGKTTTLKSVNSFGYNGPIGCDSIGLVDYSRIAVISHDGDQATVKSVPIYYDGDDDEDKVRVECETDTTGPCIRTMGTVIGSDAAYVSSDRALYATNGSQIQRCAWNAEKQQLDDCSIILERDPGGALVDGELSAATKPTIYEVSGLTSNTWNLYWAEDRTSLRALISGKKVTTIAGSVANHQSIDGERAIARIDTPAGIALGDDGMGYFGEVIDDTDDVRSRIRSVNLSNGALAHVSGAPWSRGAPVENGAPDAATHPYPMALVYRDGFVYVADPFANAVRRVSLSTGITENFAGALETTGFVDGYGSEALFAMKTDKFRMVGMVADDEYLYVTDAGNHAIRRISLGADGGEVETLAGGTEGTANGIGRAAQFMSPSALAYDRGTLYVADFGTKLIRQIDLKSAEVTTLAGVLYSEEAKDGAYGVGSFAFLFNLAADGLGNLYVADTTARGYTIIRRVDIDKQIIYPFAGSLTDAGLLPGGLPGTMVQPFGMAVDARGDLVFGDVQDGAIAVIRPL